MKRLFVFFLALALLFCIVSCAVNFKQSHTFFALDTYCTVTAWGAEESALRELESLTLSYAQLWSPTAEDALLAKLNSGAVTTADEETLFLLETASQVNGLSDGAFDVTVGALVEAYGYYDDDYRVPSEEELEVLLQPVDGSSLVSGKSVTLKEGQVLDLGGIAKGRIADLCAAKLKSLGARGAILSFGGNVCAFGTKTDGSLFTVALADPQNTSEYLGTLQVTDASLVTAGSYQRGFVQDGVYYHHILDPKTGRPANSGLLSATVMATDGAYADALSTACFVLGREGALALWQEVGNFELILVEEDGNVVCTQGLEGNFTAEDHSVEFVKKNPKNA